MKNTDKIAFKQDIRYILFRYYTLIVALLAGLFTLINYLNKRPVVNIVTGLGVGLFCLLIYFLSVKEHLYHIMRILFLSFFALIYIPFSYFTTPGTQSAMPYLMILVTFILTIVALKKWEYVFPIIVIIESVILFRFEISSPDLFDIYVDPVYRINDLSINYVVVTTAILLTNVFIMKQYSNHNKKLYDISVTDGLTGLYNKRYFESYVVSEYNRAIRENSVFSLVFIDINNFKNINNNHGHIKGDQVLKDIGRLTLDNVRNYDVCIRYGGDEFVIILPDTKKQDAKTHIKRLEHVFSEYSKAYEEDDFNISIGYTDSLNKSVDEIVGLADELMYKDKARKKRE